MAAEFERSLVCGLMHDPSRLPDVLQLVSSRDFLHPGYQALIEAMKSLAENGATIDLQAILAEMHKRGTLELLGGLAGLNELDEERFTAVEVERDARQVRRLALQRKLQQCHERGSRDRYETELYSEIEDLHEQIERLDQGVSSIAGVGFTGERLEAVRRRPATKSPLPGYLDPLPSLQLLVGSPKVGKTTFALNLAQSWAVGVPPWPSMPGLPGTRALVVSAEQPLVRLDETLCRLNASSCSSRDGWTTRVTIIARDRDLDPLGRRILVLDDQGLQTLRQLLCHAREQGDPFGLVVLDSISRLKPRDCEENDNDAMTGWLSALQELAEEEGVYILLVHHSGHAERTSPVSAARGASAIAAVAQGLWTLDRSQGRQRILRVEGNALLGSETCFEVAGEDDDPNEILYFRVIDRLDGYSLEELIGEHEEISTSELARRISGSPPKQGKRPPGKAQETAQRLRSRWEKEGRVEVRGGRGNAKMIRRLPSSEPERACMPERAESVRHAGRS